MFDLSLAEMLLIVVVAVVFIGPKELPIVIRALSKTMRKLKSFTHEIRKTFDDLAEESGIKPHMQMIRGDDGKWHESYPTIIQDSSGLESPPHIPATKDDFSI